jgi:hypothetical protein
MVIEGTKTKCIENLVANPYKKRPFGKKWYRTVVNSESTLEK